PRTKSIRGTSRRSSRGCRRGSSGGRSRRSRGSCSGCRRSKRRTTTARCSATSSRWSSTRNRWASRRPPARGAEMGFLRRLLGDRTPDGFSGALEPGEDVVDSAPVEGGGHLVVTPLGLWVPADGGARRVGWHLVAKAAWADGVFTLTESSEVGTAGSAVVLADLPPVRF